MPASGRSKRVLIYSHDSFGLGHVSRCRTIANAIVEADPAVSVLIISGSPMIGSYEFHSGIDFVRIPGVVKQIDTGEYDSANLRVGVEHTLEMRTRIIRDTADIYRPDLFIVDKEPLGLRGEVVPTLRLLKDRGTPLVLGLRDVMDDPAMLAVEWERKHVVPALRDLYDEIWIYGLPQINKPMAGIDLPPSVRHKSVYTGYLRREVPLHTDTPHEMEEIDGPFILVTPGGGADGVDLVDWVLSAYETDTYIPYGAVIVFGPFMSSDCPRGLQGARCEVPQHPHAHLHQQSRRPDAARRRRGGDGRLQHLLRDPELRQEGDHRAAHPAAAGAVHPHPRRAHARPARDARCRAWPQPAYHGDRAAPADAAGPAERRGRAGPARRHRQRAAPGQQAARPSPSRARVARCRRARRRAGRRATTWPSRPHGSGPERTGFHVCAECARCGRAEGLAAPFRDLHRAGDRRPRSTRRGARDLVAAPSDRQGAPSGPRSRRRPRRLSAGIPEGRSAPRAGGLAEGAPPARLCRRARQVPRRPAPRSDGQPTAPLGPGAGAGGRAALVDRAALRPFPAYARFGDALCRHHARCAVERVGACQGHLDQRALGSRRQARRLRLAGHLHGHGPAAPQGAGAASRSACSSSITASIWRICRRRRWRVRAATAATRPIPS